MGQICVFFGHRFIPNQSLVKAGLTDVILDLIRSKGVDEFWLGGYGDFDHLAFEVLRNIKKEHPTITRSLALAYLPTNQEDYDWKKSSYDHVFVLKELKKDLCALPSVGEISGWPKMRILLFAMWIPKAVAFIRLYA